MNDPQAAKLLAILTKRTLSGRMVWSRDPNDAAWVLGYGGRWLLTFDAEDGRLSIEAQDGSAEEDIEGPEWKEAFVRLSEAIWAARDAALDALVRELDDLEPKARVLSIKPVPQRGWWQRLWFAVTAGLADVLGVRED